MSRSALTARAGAQCVPSGSRRFWLAFGGGWAAYLALLGGSALLEGESAAPVLLMSLPPALLALPLAWRRHDLANPDRGRLRGAVLLTGVGLLYAMACSLLILLLMTLTRPEGQAAWSAQNARMAASFVFLGLLLYAVQLGFLLWSVSLERLQESRALAAREAVLRANAEAKALRAQFNPHFVFNTLHSLMLLVREDPATAERAIEDVAALIRYASTLQRRGQDAVALGQELDMARRYLALEALRLEERLRVDWEVTPDLAGMAIPAFSLQTLLENAIKHGLSPKPEGGTIRVAVVRRGGEMSLEVEDDGMGAVPEEVTATAGSGLRLLEARVTSLYGDAGSLSWRTAPERGFRVTLKWPAAAMTPPADADPTRASERRPGRGGSDGRR